MSSPFLMPFGKKGKLDEANYTWRDRSVRNRNH